VVDSVERLNDAAAESKRREKKLLMDIAKYEGVRVKAALQSGKNALVWWGGYHPLAWTDGNSQ
jgi:hypothetical protein